MKSNIPKHPCKNKCTNFKEEQCNTCLIPSNSMELESESDFLVGDVVVCVGNFVESLFFVTSVGSDFCVQHTKNKRIYKASTDRVRHATVAELQANRRLTEAEQALAEVS